MDEKKICPFMSRPSSKIFDRFFGIPLRSKGKYCEFYNDFIPCMESECKAWSGTFCKLIEGKNHD